MKTNGLRNKKKAMARAAARTSFRMSGHRWDDSMIQGVPAIERWHRAAKGRK